MKMIVVGMLAGLLPAASAQAAGACGGTLHKESSETVLYVDKATASCPWPFTTDKLVLGCQGMSLVAVTEDGKSWALNGTARHQLKLPSIDPIWKQNPENPVAKLDMEPYFQAAKALCR